MAEGYHAGWNARGSKRYRIASIVCHPPVRPMPLSIKGCLSQSFVPPELLPSCHPFSLFPTYYTPAAAQIPTMVDLMLNSSDPNTPSDGGTAPGYSEVHFDVEILRSELPTLSNGVGVSSAPSFMIFLT